MISQRTLNAGDRHAPCYLVGPRGLADDGPVRLEPLVQIDLGEPTAGERPDDFRCLIGLALPPSALAVVWDVRGTPVELPAVAALMVHPGRLRSSLVADEDTVERIRAASQDAGRPIDDIAGVLAELVTQLGAHVDAIVAYELRRRDALETLARHQGLSREGAASDHYVDAPALHPSYPFAPKPPPRDER
jgi:hypothetical protein